MDEFNTQENETQEEVEETFYKNPDSVYFAAKEAPEVMNVMLQRARTFYDRLESNKYLDTVRNMWKAYHGYYTDGEHEISFTGEQGELVDIPVNHFRNLAKHVHTMITSSRPIMEARAVNTDYKSLAQTHLANGILDYYMREKGIEEALLRASEMAIVLGTGYIKLEWNATDGEAYDVDPNTGEFNYEGELEVSTPSVLDVIIDGTKETWCNEWVMVRSFVNRFNLAAKYPEYADKVTKLDTKNNSNIKTLSIFSNDDTDDIPIYEFFHKKTEAMPEGRYILAASSDIILIDAPLPYREIPVYRMVPSEILGTPYGYSDMFDVYPLQEQINASYAAAASNQNAFAVQNVYVPRGADLTISSLSGGLNVIEGNAKPEPLNLTHTPQEVFSLIKDMIQTSETFTGINSVTRGNPEYSLKSGAALAMVQSMALQFNSKAQQNYVKMIENVGTGLINILKDYANTPKLIALVGRNNRPLLKEFTGDMIDSINRVIVDIGNPLSRTIAGRVQMAEQLAQMKLLKNPNQYFQVMNTGRLDSAFEGEMSELLLIKQENESILNGEKPTAAFLDRHSEHINEHKAVMADPELRKDSNLMRILAEHIQEHIDLLKNTDPEILMLIGEQPLSPPAPQGMNNMNVVEGSPNSQIMNGQSPLDAELMRVQGAEVPGVPSPPPPFDSLPTNPADMV